MHVASIFLTLALCRFQIPVAYLACQVGGSMIISKSPYVVEMYSLHIRNVITCLLPCCNKSTLGLALALSLAVVFASTAVHQRLPYHRKIRLELTPLDHPCSS